MSLEHELAHEPKGVIKLAPGFWGKPRIAAFLIGLLAEVQAVEDAIWTFLDGVDVDTAERWALERLAKIVGETRRPTSDEALRLYVKAKILINRSDGTPSFIADLITAMTSGEVHVIEDAEEIRALQYDDPPVDPDVAAELLDAVIAAGKQSCWLTNCGDGSWALPSYGDASPDLTRRTGVGTWSNRHG